MKILGNYLVFRLVNRIFANDMAQKVIFSEQLERTLETAIGECHPDRLFVLTDDNTRRLCWPVVKDYGCLAAAQLITIPAGDEHKNLTSLSHVWQQLQQGGATRHSLMVCLGGGMVTDLGGFAASTFKRGIAFINIPTTLLAMVDASVGGKTGINFCGLKNEVGVFSDSKFVILNADFLSTLDKANLLSGYAEMLKHGLIANEQMWAELTTFDIAGEHTVWQRLQRMVADSVRVKEQVVAADPHEKGLRKALNLGHTFGHAFESWSYGFEEQGTKTKEHGREPLLHGYAVAFGLIAELYLSVVKCGFPTEQMRQTVSFIRQHYGNLPITCDDYDNIIALMRHDKKNRGTDINVTLLAGIGQLRIDQTIDEEMIREALDFVREDF